MSHVEEVIAGVLWPFAVEMGQASTQRSDDSGTDEGAGEMGMKVGAELREANERTEIRFSGSGGVH